MKRQTSTRRTTLSNRERRRLRKKAELTMPRSERDAGDWTGPVVELTHHKRRTYGSVV